MGRRDIELFFAKGGNYRDEQNEGLEGPRENKVVQSCFAEIHF